MKKLTSSVLLVIVGLFAVGCSNDSTSEVSEETRRFSLCALPGVWKTCQPKGSDSQEVRYEIDETNTAWKTVTRFTGSVTCGGSGSLTMSGTIGFSLGENQASSKVLDGTDVTLTPASGVDTGCGTNIVSYLALKYSGCSKFKMTEPACTPTAVSGSLGTSIYQRQN